MTRPRVVTAVSFLCALVAAGGASAAPPPVRGIGVEETLASGPVLAPAVDAAHPAPELPTLVRLSVSRGELETAPGTFAFEGLEARVALYAARKVPVVIALGELPTMDQSETWKTFVRAVAERCRGKVKGYELSSAHPRPAAHDAAFVLKLTAVQVRAVDPDALVVLGGLTAPDAEWLEALYREEVAAYLEGMGLAAPDAVASLVPLVQREDPSAAIVLGGLSLPPDPAAASRQLVDWELRLVGTGVSATVFTATADALGPALRSAANLKDVLTGEVVTLDDKTTGLKLTLEGKDVTTSFPHRLLYDVTRFATYFIYWGSPEMKPTDVLQVELAESAGKPPVIRDAVTNKQGVARDFLRDQRTKTSRVNVLPVPDRPLLLDFHGPDEAYVSRAEVTEGVLPPVSEVIARHQEAQTAQDEIVHTYIADAHMEQHFRPSVTDPGFDVVTENRFFLDPEGTEWEELSFTLNGSKWGANRPPFPLLQPEKVLSLPLDLRLNKDYRYKLESIDKVGDRSAYVVRFDPLDDTRSLYRGTVWIDTKTYVKLKVESVQTRLSAPVVSSEEVQYFTPVAEADGHPLWLFSHLVGKQIMLVAGRNLLVERDVRFANFRVNDPQFATTRAGARGTNHVMFRDTEKGLRYFVKKGEERIVQENATTTAKALAFGVTIDPSYDYPLPILGINYLDFNFLGKDNQLALLFGGVLALANVQRPKLIGSKIDGSVDLFAIAVAVNDQVYDASGERRDERLRNHPFQTGFNLGWQFTGFQKLTGTYQFRFDGYGADSRTSPSFVVPPSTITNGFGLAYEYKRKGYSLGGSAFNYRRGTWRAWGQPTDFDPDQRSYDKYSASLSKDFFFGLHKIHLNAAYYGGRRLDRFSVYQFGMFDENKIHGVPSAGVRFGELAMLRGGYSFNLFDLYRVDLFLEHAIGRDPFSDKQWRGITGLGLGLNLRTPFGTLLRTDLGKSFLPAQYRGSGSFVGQILILKPI